MITLEPIGFVRGRRSDLADDNRGGVAARGADTAVWLACEAPHGLTGKCFRDRQEVPRWACPASEPKSS